LELQHSNNLVADTSGSSRLDLSGLVQGTGRLSISGSAQLNAEECQMEIVKVQTSGAGYASVNGAQEVHASVSGAGTICYRGTLVSQRKSGAGSIQPCVLEQISAEL
ncbi:unnamed protein product, partial [Rotaria sp. Silwood2]